MERVSNFLDKAPLWKVFLLGCLIAGLFCILVWGGLESISGKPLVVNVLVKLGLAMGFMVGGLMFTLMTSMMRKSQKFWDYAKEVGVLIDKCKTKSELEEVFKKEFQTLKSMSLGNPHSAELHRLYAIMETKYKLIN